MDSTTDPLRRSIRSTRLEAVPFAIMTGLTDPFMIPYALALGASALQAGLISSARNFVVSIAQVRSVEAVHLAGSRRRLVLWVVGLQAALWVPIAFVQPLFGGWAVAALIALYTIGTTGAALGGPAWGSMVSEYLPGEKRGRFLGQRDMLVGIGTAAAGMLAGALLHRLSARPLAGFALLCLMAALCRGLSWLSLRSLVDLPWHEPAAIRASFRSFLRRAPHDNFVRFSLCFGAFNFAVNFAVPYLTIYMLMELRYGYLTYAVITLSGTMLGNLLIPRWGRVADRRGNRVVLRWTMAGASLVPFIWGLSARPEWLMFAHLIGGFLWGGINLCAVNFVYDAAGPSTRTRSLAYFNVINGCCISLGTLAGGWCLTGLPEVNGSAFIGLFMVSGVMRCLATALFDSVVKEVRPVRQSGLREVLRDLVGQRVVQILGYDWGRDKN